MYQRMPCQRCGGPKPSGPAGRGKVCGRCSPLDVIWPRLLEGDGGCWIWPGRLCPSGYGRYGAKPIHRMTYEFLIGEIPPGLDLDHLCLVKTCVNPWHLEPVTRSENSRRRCAITHCKNGHEFTPENTYMGRTRGYPQRNCRTCGNAQQRRYQARKKAARS